MFKPVSPATIDYNHLAAFTFGKRLIHKLPLLFDFSHINGKNGKADSKLCTIHMPVFENLNTRTEEMALKIQDLYITCLKK
jgi:hypothetical protein